MFEKSWRLSAIGEIGYDTEKHNACVPRRQVLRGKSTASSAQQQSLSVKQQDLTQNTS